METLQQKLRRIAGELRIKPYPIKDLIPLLQRAADKLDSLENSHHVYRLK